MLADIPRRVARCSAGVIALAAVILILIVTAAPPASAHADIASSDPSSGATVKPGFSKVTLTFTKAAEPAGDGFGVVGPKGEVTVSARSNSSGTVWTLKLDKPAVEGAWTVNWKIMAGDSHSREGTITFTAGKSDASTTSVAPPSGSMSMPMPMPASPKSATDSTSSWLSWQLVATLGRIIWMIGLIVPAGLVSFMLWVFEGSTAEMLFAERWIRLLALVGLAGVLMEVVGSLTDLDFDLSALWGPLGIAFALRLVAGVAFARDLRLVPVTPPAPGEGPKPPPGLRYSSNGDLIVGQPRTSGRLQSTTTLLHPRLALLGVSALVASMLADGHTVDADPRMLMWLVTIAHVVAGAVWVGGVASLAFLLSSRWKRGRRLDAATLGFRFSRIAGLSLGLVGLAGTALAFDILDSPGQLLSSTWGRLLLVKLLAVAVAAGCGGYNHFLILPEIAEFERLGPAANEATEHHLRRVGIIELTAMLVVLAATGWMVGSSPT